MKFFITYGWHALLAAVIGEMVVPLLLAPFYKGYRSTAMAISTLGNKNSPVRVPFNIWMLLAGILFLSSTPALYAAYLSTSGTLALASALCVAIFAVGACIFSCFFIANETKDIVTTASKIHGAASATGFLLLLPVPLFLAILSFRTSQTLAEALSAICFVLALLFFALFIMADTPGLPRSIVTKEGLWQRLNLFFLYLPLGYIAASNIFG